MAASTPGPWRARGAALIAAALLIALVPLSAGAARAAPENVFKLIRLKGAVMKWGAPRLGTGATVRYAFVDRRIAHPKARNCRTMRPLAGLLAASGIDRAALRREAEAAFAQWAAAADIRFRRVEDPARADILIGAQMYPRGRAWADVDFRAAPGARVGALKRSLICLNPARKWKVGFDGDLTVYDIRYTLAHEIGHAIGLDHPGASGPLMSYRYNERSRDLRPGDIAGAALLYGAAPALGPAAGPVRDPAAGKTTGRTTGSAARRARAEPPTGMTAGLTATGSRPASAPR